VPPRPLRQVVAVVVGIQAMSLAVQLTAYAQLATSDILKTIWWAVVGLGLPALVMFRKSLALTNLLRVPPVAISMATAAAALNLLAAVAPSSKIDEIFYHMLVPSRIVSDETLRIYHEPIESAVLPQMSYQIFAAPLHALGYPDAANIVSWALALS